MSIEWNKVTWYSKILAVILFVGTFFLGFWLGTTNTEKVYVESPRMAQLSQQTLDKTMDTNDASVEASSDTTNLTPYVFESYSTSSGQFLLQGELAPTMVQTEESKISIVALTLRCWKKETRCALVENFNKWNISQLDLLTVKSWDNNMILIEGVTGNFPDSGKAISQIQIKVDLKKNEARLQKTLCGGACATDEYLVVGAGDGIHQTRSDLPLPEVSLVDISF